MSTPKPATQRTVNVQVPGEAPEQAAAAQIDAPEELPGISSAPSDAIDIEALRAELLEQARSEVRAELGQKPKAAGSKSDYRNMRADQIDPATLVAPVMTKDGWLCPPAPEAKK